MKILFFALAHGVPLFICRLFTQSRIALLCVAAVMVFVAVGAGSPAYSGVDVAVVGAFLWLLWPSKSAASSPAASSPAKPEDSCTRQDAAAKSSGVGYGAAWGGALGAICFLIFLAKSISDLQMKPDVFSLCFFVLVGAAIGAWGIRR